jgi:hypothetical protein
LQPVHAVSLYMRSIRSRTRPTITVPQVTWLRRKLGNCLCDDRRRIDDIARQPAPEHHVEATAAATEWSSYSNCASSWIVRPSWWSTALLMPARVSSLQRRHSDTERCSPNRRSRQFPRQTSARSVQRAQPKDLSARIGRTMTDDVASCSQHRAPSHDAASRQSRYCRSAEGDRAGGRRHHRSHLGGGEHVEEGGVHSAALEELVLRQQRVVVTVQ